MKAAVHGSGGAWYWMRGALGDGRWERKNDLKENLVVKKREFWVAVALQAEHGGSNLELCSL